VGEKKEAFYDRLDRKTLFFSPMFMDYWGGAKLTCLLALWARAYNAPYLDKPF
jgi:hypothetical protein